MAGAKFQYDESGGTFFYFLLSFLALVVIPGTYYFWPSEKKKGDTKHDKNGCHCEHCAVKRSLLRTNEPWKKTKNRFIKIVLLIGWAFLFATAYKVAHLQHDYIAWDPYEILQIDPASSIGEIKKAYRKLSLVYHPDKDTGDEKKFMMIAKAYAALTDEEARKNWEQYGNPDGPGATSFGIALPSWIVEKENSIWVLGLYALVFMVGLPIVVGAWWYRSVKYGGDQVLLDTTQLFYYFIHKTPHMILKRVVMIVAASLEFERGHNSEIIERPSDNIEVPQLIKELPNLGEKKKERPLCFSYSVKARALLHAHLSRMKLPQNTLEQDKNYVIKKLPYLIQEFVQCVSQLTMLALAGRISRYPNLETMENAMKLCPMVVQALWDNKIPLLQLPHITEDMLRHFTTRKRNIRNIKQFASMKEDDRRNMLRSLTDEQYSNIINVLAKFPLLELEVRSEVLDDEETTKITAGAIVTVTVNLIRRNMETIFDQEAANDPEPVQEEIEEETARDSPQIQKPKSWEKQKKKKGKTKAKPKKGGGGKGPQNKKPAIAPVPTNESKTANEAPAKVKEERVHEKESDESGSESDTASSHSEEMGGAGERISEMLKEDEESEDEDDWERIQQKVSRKEKVLETKSKKSHSVHCPFFHEDKQEYWWVYLVDKKKHSLVSVPYLVTNLVDQEEVELKFTAPTKVGIYTYNVVVKSDSYMELDVSTTIKLDVKEAKAVDMAHPQWDISDDEEDKEEESAVEDSDLATDDDGDESC